MVAKCDLTSPRGPTHRVGRAVKVGGCPGIVLRPRGAIRCDTTITQIATSHLEAARGPPKTILRVSDRAAPSSYVSVAVDASPPTSASTSARRRCRSAEGRGFGSYAQRVVGRLVYVDLCESAARRPAAWVILAIGVLLFKGNRPGDAGGPVFSDPRPHAKVEKCVAIYMT